MTNAAYKSLSVALYFSAACLYAKKKPIRYRYVITVFLQEVILNYLKKNIAK